MKAALLCVGALALVLSTGASAHVTVQPSSVESSEQTLTFTVPNELVAPGARSQIGRIVVEVSPASALVHADPKVGWTARKRAGEAVWTGGSIFHDEMQTFTVTVDAPSDRKELSIVVAEYYAVPRGRIERFPISVPVEANGGSGGWRTVAIAGAAGAVLLAAGSWALVRWLRGSRP